MSSEKQLFLTVPQHQLNTKPVNSLCSPNPIPISPITLPTTDFSWPINAQEIAEKLLSNGFTLTQRGVIKDDHLPMITGSNHHVGREEMSSYTYKRNSHSEFEDPTTGFPDLAKLLIPEAKVEKSQYMTNPAFQPTIKDEVLIVSLIHYGPNCCGWFNVVHGGMLASIADVVMFSSYCACGRAGVTGGLSMTYKSPTPANTVLLGVSCCEIAPKKGNSRMALYDTTLSQTYFESSSVFITPSPWLGKSIEEVEAILRQSEQKPNNDVKPAETSHATQA